MRSLLEAHLADLEAQAAALRDVLATTDPEHAERAMLDGARVRVTEVALCPQPGRAAILSFVEQGFRVEPT